MIERNVSVGFGSNNTTKVRVSQFDSMWTFVFAVYMDGERWTIPNGLTVQMNGRKPDKNVFAFPGTIVNNTVKVDCDIQMTACAGQTICELVFLDANEKTVGTANFILAVEPAPKSPDDVSSESTLPAYAAVLNAVTEDDESVRLAAASAAAAQAVLESIPSDYSTLQEDVDDLKSDLEELEIIDDAVKEALLACFRHVNWTDHDEDYYSDLQDALYPDAITSITATFSQGNYMFSVTDDLDDLKPFLTVTANRRDGTTSTITEYTLSGTLSSSSSTITVSYLTFTATFTVTVKQLPSGYTLKSYVQSDTSQYIGTNITEVEAGSYSYRSKVRPVISSSLQNTRLLMHLFSSLNFYTAVYRYEGASSKSKFLTAKRWGTDSSSISGVSSAWEFDADYVISAYANDNKVYIDGNAKIQCEIGSTKDSDNKMYLLGYSGAAGNANFRFSGRIYYFKTYSIGTNTKTHDFVPCLNSSSVAGVYDMVTDQFYAPTVGTLVAG